MRSLFLLLSILTVTLALLVGTTPVNAVSVSSLKLDIGELDAYVTGQMSKHGIKGISLAVTSGTEIVYLKGYGTAGNGLPMTPITPMYIESLKSAQATLSPRLKIWRIMPSP